MSRTQYEETLQAMDILKQQIKKLEAERTAAVRKTESWNRDKEVKKLKQELAKAKRDLSLGFNPTAEQWKDEQAWEARHINEKHHDYLTSTEITKMRPDSPYFQYQFEHTNVGTLGSVVCLSCKKKHFASEMDYSFFFGDVN